MSGLATGLFVGFHLSFFPLKNPSSVFHKYKNIIINNIKYI